MKGFLGKNFPFPMKWPMKEIFDVAITFATDWMNKKISERKPVTSDSSAEEYQAVQRDLEILKRKVEVEMAQIEQFVAKEITVLFDQYESVRNRLLEKGVSFSLGQGVYARELIKTKRDYEGFVSQQVSASMSLTNRKLMLILAMTPGSRKEEVMNRFVQDNIREALFMLSNKFEEDIVRLSVEMTDDISEEIRVLEQEHQNQVHSLELLLDDHVDIVMRKERLLSNVYIRVKVANELLGRLET